MQVEPQQILPLVYILTDPLDSGTYYIRAVVKDSLTGDTIETKNLASQGSGRYTSTFNAPIDSTGFGRHIDVTISVYTDSGYTSFSDVYQKKIDKYLVKRNMMFGGGGSGGSDIDYDKIAKILARIVEEKFAGIKHQEIDLESVYKAIDAVGEKIKPIEIPPFPLIPPIPPTDLSPIIRSIESLGKQTKEQINAIKFPEQKEVDFSELTSSMESLKEEVSNISIEDFKNIAREIKIMMETFTSRLTKLNKLKEMMKDMMDESANLPVPPNNKDAPGEKIKKYT